MINLPDLYPDTETVDQTAYCILLRIKESDKPLWKRELTRKLNEWRRNDLCPLNIREKVSVQTISRRVNSLEDGGYLDANAFYAEKLGKYVEGYSLTQKGKNSLERISDDILDNLLATYAERCIRSEALVLKQGALEKIAANSTMKPESKELQQIQEELRSRLSGDNLQPIVQV